MLLDLHTHTSGISWCCRVPADQGVKTAKENGYDGMVVTNHYTPEYVKDTTFGKWIDRYIDEYYLTKELGEKTDFKVFLGVEVTLAYKSVYHMLIYGADERFLRENKELYYYSEQDLYKLCKNNGCALIQAHPFRNGAVPLNPDYVDGYEINCHPHPAYDGTHSWDIPQIAAKAGKVLTCGTDYHGDTYRAHGGTYVPDTIKTGKDIADYLLTTDKIKLRIEEKDAHEYYEKTFNINR